MKLASILLFILLVTSTLLGLPGSVSAGTAYTGAVGIPPVITRLAWKTWYTRLLAFRQAECHTARTTTYYFAASGSDGSGNGTVEAPYQTITKAQSLLAADVRLRFRRGDTFLSPTGLSINASHVTVDDYGSVADPKPILSRFNAPYSQGQWSLVPGTANGRCWKAAENSTVAWLRETGSVNSIYRQMTSVAAVDATPGSWGVDLGSHLIYVNPSANNAANANPATGQRQFESVTANTNCGIQVGASGSVDDILIQNIRIDGFTANVTDLGGQGITGHLTGTDAMVLRGVEVYYSDRHNIANVGSVTGGIVTMIQCKYGWTTSQEGRGPTVVYMALGGQEALWHECESVGDVLPIGAIPYGGATQGSPGQLCHSDGVTAHTAALMIAYGCFNRPGQWQTGAMSDNHCAPAFSDLVRCRSFVVNETFDAREPSVLDQEATPPGASSYGIVGTVLESSLYTAVVNCRFTSRMVWNSLPANNQDFARYYTPGIMLNSSMTFDCAGSPAVGAASPRDMFAATAAGQFYNCRLHMRTYGNTQAFISQEVQNNPASGSSALKAFNSILSADGVGSGVSYYAPGLGNIAANQINNAYSNASSAHKSLAEGYDQDPFYVEVSDLPFGHPPTDSPLRTTHNQLIQGTYRLEYDADWTPRSLATPAIGPYEPVQPVFIGGKGF